VTVYQTEDKKRKPEDNVKMEVTKLVLMWFRLSRLSWLWQSMCHTIYEL